MSKERTVQKKEVMTTEIGAVYIATNKVEKNSILAFKQFSDGSLKIIGEFQSGGKGTGNIEIFDWGFDETHPLKDGVDPLISAYGIFKTQNNKNVILVNSGDATISLFEVQNDHSLKLTSTTKAADIHPLSIASHKNIVYVASSGNVANPPFSGNISGYTIEEGQLKPIKDSTRNLNARPSCVAFTNDGKYLVVNELVTGMIKVFSIDTKGILSKKPISIAASPHAVDKGRWLPIPVGFDIITKGDEYIVFVSEARFLDNKGMLREDEGKVEQSPKYSWQTGSTSSYKINTKGEITLVSGDVMTGQGIENGQIANCWVEVSEDGNTLWAANALSSSLTSYSIGANGELNLKNEKAFKNNDESLFFSDLFLSSNGKYLNQLIGNKGNVMVFKVMENGNLKAVGTYSGAPKVGAYGLITL